jgi:RHS repeat-associated core domain protein (fragment)
MIPKEFQNKPSNGTFMYKMNVMGWSMYDKKYASWKNAVNKKMVMDYLMFLRKNCRIQLWRYEE